MLHTRLAFESSTHREYHTANSSLVSFFSPCTSAKDKVILESAYNANPKPDKAARLDIVKRVSLNEKEVQVRICLDSASTLRRAHTCLYRSIDVTRVKHALGC